MIRKTILFIFFATLIGLGLAMPHMMLATKLRSESVYRTESEERSLTYDELQKLTTTEFKYIEIKPDFIYKLKTDYETLYYNDGLFRIGKRRKLTATNIVSTPIKSN